MNLIDLPHLNVLLNEVKMSTEVILLVYIYIKLLISTYLNIDFNVSVFSRGNIIFFSLVRKACA